MKYETFSVVMPAYNAEKTIAESIHSVLNQSYKYFKLYIVNDYSVDNTESIVKKITDKRMIYLKNNGQPGVANARNVALEAISGDYVAFLDSDDLWLPDKLSQQVRILQSGYDLVFSWYYTFRTSSPGKLYCRTSPKLISGKSMLKINYIGNLTGVYNVKKTGVIKQKNIGHEDYLMWLEIIKKTRFAYCIQQPLALYRLSPHSLSANKLKAAYWQWKIYRDELCFPLATSLYYFSCYAQKSLKKRICS